LYRISHVQFIHVQIYNRISHVQLIILNAVKRKITSRNSFTCLCLSVGECWVGAGFVLRYHGDVEDPIKAE